VTCRGHQSFTADHSGLSPSGRTSAAGRLAWLRREADRMRASERRDSAARAACPECNAAAARHARERTELAAGIRLDEARNLRRLVAAGIKPRAKMLRLAAQLEKEAAELLAQPGQDLPNQPARRTPGSTDGSV
jgi:hypothetical protein